MRLKFVLHGYVTDYFYKKDTHTTPVHWLREKPYITSGGHVYSENTLAFITEPYKEKIPATSVMPEDYGWGNYILKKIG